MFTQFFDPNERQIKRIRTIVDKINSLEQSTQALSHEQIREKTSTWKQNLMGLDDGAQDSYLNQILPEAYALVREASKRVLDKRHYDVQLIAGVVLHEGKIAEQKTGEGKTLTATLPLYLNALTGKGVHLVTPNDYLSRRGAGWMGAIYDYLGLTTGVVIEDKAFIYDPEFDNQTFMDEYATKLREVSRVEAYKCDITYGTNHHFGFDYLRDNMARSLSQVVQTNPRGDSGFHNFVIVDEVDNILIDIARTPLILSTSDSKPSDRYYQATNIIKGLIKGTDFETDEKSKRASLTDLGIRRIENMLGIKNLYEDDFEMVHLIEQSLAAFALYEKNRDYIVKDGRVMIVDQFTGRLLKDNRFSDGLHQALEAKENVPIQQESKTLASVSYQNYFRLYKKIAGMTGTAVTEAEEFYKIYKLDVVVIPTHRTTVRKDLNDVIYKTESAKFAAIAEEISKAHQKGQPVLVGTTSVDKSEMLHDLLKRKKIPHEVLNAKQDEREALIIAQAGRKGSVTVSTNMAGRGVDILLGGDPATEEEQAEIKELGGLYVIGTERHESRRIDNQLRGRAGRQGDAGISRFYVSLQDDLMRIFGGSTVENLMTRLGLDENVPLEAGMVSRAIESAQKKVEGFNFDMRKQVVEMDDVMNVHRDVIYKLRRRVLEVGSGDLTHKDWLLKKLSDFGGSEVLDACSRFEKSLGAQQWFYVMSQLSLEVIDYFWMEHLTEMDHLRQGIGLRSYAQRDPMVEYKREGHNRFELLIGKIYSDISERIKRFENISPVQKPTAPLAKVDYTYGKFESGVSDESKTLNSPKNPYEVKAVESGDKVGRNDLCPCGSGKKYKNCHGKN